MTEVLRFRINVPKVIHETIEGETVLVNLDSGNYYSLDGVGADVWGLIERGVNGGGIVEWLAGQYRGERVEIEKALYELINDMQQEELIVLDERGGSENIMDQGGDDKGSSHEQLKDFIPPLLHKYTDMQDLLLLDPIHEVDETGWPSPKTAPPFSEK
jgi:hypothetical protein